jgi:hypothetical protein
MAENDIQSEPRQPELAGDDLQRSPEQDPDHHRDSSAILQEAIVDLVARCEGSSLETAISTFEDTLAKRGQPQQPPRWVEAVATDAIAGRTYVVNQQALDDTGVRVPAHDFLEESTGRDRGQDPV